MELYECALGLSVRYHSNSTHLHHKEFNNKIGCIRAIETSLIDRNMTGMVDVEFKTKFAFDGPDDVIETYIIKCHPSNLELLKSPFEYTWMYDRGSDGNIFIITKEINDTQGSCIHMRFAIGPSGDSGEIECIDDYHEDDLDATYARIIMYIKELEGFNQFMQLLNILNIQFIPKDHG